MLDSRLLQSALDTGSSTIYLRGPALRLGPYEVEREVGRGGMGIVYRARDRRDGREGQVIALKVAVLGPPGSETDARRARFEREAKLLATLDHPAIPKVHGFGEEGGLLYLACDFLDGETLYEAARRGAPLRSLVAAVRDAASALEHAHQHEVYHRDVKPENILIVKDRAYLVDFGLARVEGASQQLSLAGQMIGTPAFLAPEQIDQKTWGPISPKTDVRGLGATLFYCVSGRLPVHGRTLGEIVKGTTERDAPPLAEVAPDAPTTLARVCDEALARAQDDRPDVATMIVRLERWLELAPDTELERPAAGEKAFLPPSSIPSPQPGAPPGVPRGRGLAVAAATAVGVAALAIAGIVGARGVYRPADADPAAAIAPSGQPVPPPPPPSPAPGEEIPRIETVRTDEPVGAALDWLARHQGADGGWDAEDWGAACGPNLCRPEHGYNGFVWDEGNPRYGVGVTGLATLALLGDGYTHQRGAYADAISRALAFLISRQKEDGSIGFGEGEEIYNHAIATRALCRAYRLTKDEKLFDPALAAVAFCLSLQNPGAGWRYAPGESDTSVTGFMVAALADARRAGFSIPDEAFEGALAWIDRTTSAQDGSTSYRTPGAGSSVIPMQQGRFIEVPTMTAAGIITRLRCGQSKREYVIGQGRDLLLRNLPKWTSNEDTRLVNFYYWYHGTLATSELGGPAWARWRPAVLVALIQHQRAGGDARGSWDPVGEWCIAGGRVYATAMGALTLQEVERNKP